MQIADEKIEIHRGGVDERGQHAEPEEEKATHVVMAPVSIALGNQAVEGRKVVAEKLTRIGQETTAYEMALDQSTLCHLCAHFRNQDWLTVKKKFSDPSNREGGDILNKMRAEILGAESTELPLDVREIDHDVEHALGELGVCAAWTEEDRELSVTPPYGGCPQERSFFTPKDRRAQRESSAAYDKILRAAQGFK
jgi:hypothetical protein